MKKHEAEFMAAYGEALDAQFEALSAEAREHPPELSEAFEERMAELFRSGPSRRAHSGLGKRILTVAAAAAVMLLVFLGFTSERIRKSVAGFFIELFDDHVEITRPDVTKTSIEEEYGLVPIPEGYEIVSEEYFATFFRITYMDAEENEISLKQSFGSNGGPSVNNENVTASEVDINGKTVLIIFSDADHYAGAYWVENGYFFSLHADAPKSIEQFKEWIKSVRIK